jgi:hypothetical protein
MWRQTTNKRDLNQWLTIAESARDNAEALRDNDDLLRALEREGYDTKAEDFIDNNSDFLQELAKIDLVIDENDNADKIGLFCAIVGRGEGFPEAEYRN